MVLLLHWSWWFAWRSRERRQKMVFNDSRWEYGRNSVDERTKWALLSNAATQRSETIYLLFIVYGYPNSYAHTSPQSHTKLSSNYDRPLPHWKFVFFSFVFPHFTLSLSVCRDCFAICLIYFTLLHFLFRFPWCACAPSILSMAFACAYAPWVQKVSFYRIETTLP